MDTMKASEEAHKKYSIPRGLKIVECYEDINGEFVPKPVFRSQ